jgi:glucose/arabinose dehydrogenase
MTCDRGRSNAKKNGSRSAIRGCLAFCTATSLALFACKGNPARKPSSAPTSAGVGAASESATSSVEGKPDVLFTGLAGPTQIAFGPSGTWLVAELGGEEPSGDENGSTGRVLLIDPATKKQRVLAHGLDKPTGVAWIDGVVWIMVRRGIVKLPLPSAPLVSLMTALTAASEPEVSVVLADLPFNGRSEGTITPFPNGTFLYETTGTIINNPASGKAEPQPGSGTLWLFDPQTAKSTALGVGLKNSYAHVVLSDGRIGTTEIGDNIALEPLDEVNMLSSEVLQPGPSTSQSFGWPICDAENKPLASVDAAACSKATPAMRTFPAHVTPTGIAQYNDDLFVSLFVSGQIMRLPNDATPTKLPTSKRSPMEAFASGLEGPHTLLVDGTRLLVTETTAGRIIAFDLTKFNRR